MRIRKSWLPVRLNERRVSVGRKDVDRQVRRISTDRQQERLHEAARGGCCSRAGAVGHPGGRPELSNPTGHHRCAICGGWTDGYHISYHRRILLEDTWAAVR